MPLQGKRVAVLIEDVYEDLEFWYPYYRLQEEEAEVVVLGTGKKRYKGKHGLVAEADEAVAEVSANQFDGVVIPGGYAPDRMRRHPALVEFVEAIFQQQKLVAWICHGGWIPVSAGIVRGRQVTSFFSIRDDLENADAVWIDKAVVCDGNLVSSRYPKDLPYFCRAIIAFFSET